MKTLAFSLCMLASPALAQDPASHPVKNNYYGIHIDGDAATEKLIILPILFIVFGLPSLVGVVAIVLDHRRKKDREATLRQALQTQNVPPELMQLLTRGRSKADTEARSLPQAVFLGCILAGVGCIPALQKYGIMLFFMFMAAGYILRAYLTQKQK